LSGQWLLGGANRVEANRIRYNGSDISLKGGMDRFVLPAEFRRSVRESGRGERTLCFQLSDELPCLIGFGLSRQDDFEAKLDREEELARDRGEPYNRTLRSTQLFGFRTVTFDDSGRFIMPPRFLSAVGITDRIFFAAAGEEFLMFDPETLFGLGDEWRHLKIACEEALDSLAKPKGRK
jgi:MraZ protein